jgi:KEOPS complex subunit Pcc1
MSQSAKATVRLKFSSQRQLTTMLDALKPETGAPATRRATVQLETEGLFLVLTVKADDTVALRSTLNAYLRWINSDVKVMELLEQTTAS